MADDYDDYEDDFFVAGNPTSATATDNLTPRAGVVYQPTNTTSLYVSYSESFEPNGTVSGGFVNDGDPLDPTTGEQFEIGAKAEFYDRALLLSAALFDTYRSNIPFSDTVNNILVQRGEQRHRGWEATVTGLVGDHLSLVGSLAFLDAEFTEDDNPSLIGNTPSGVADFSASIWAEYQFLDGALANLSLQGGWFYEDDRPGDEAGQLVVGRQRRDLTDQRAGDVRVLVAGHEEDGLDLRVELPVGEDHCELRLHVGHRPHAADDQPGARLADEPHGEPLERLHGDVPEPGRLDRPLDQLGPVLDVEQRRLVGVHPHADDQLVGDQLGPLHHVEVPQRDGVERPGVNGAARHARSEVGSRKWECGIQDT